LHIHSPSLANESGDTTGFNYPFGRWAGDLSEKWENLYGHWPLCATTTERTRLWYAPASCGTVIPMEPWWKELPSLMREGDAEEFKKLMEAEYGQPVTLQQASEYGEAFLWWCILAPMQLGPKGMAAIKTIMDESGNRAPAPPAQPALSEQEKKALAFIRNSRKGDHAPSIREICRAVGFRSSRSGLLLIKKLMGKGFVRRDKLGALELCKATDFPREN
jgi:hypothetical protein